MNKHFIIMTLLLCGISQQSSSLYVTHFSPESNDARTACIVKTDPKIITQEQIDMCISAMKHYITAMSKRGSHLLTQYNWLMHHTDKLTVEQIAVLKSFKQNLATHEALKTFKMISSWLADEDSLRARDVMTNSYQTQLIANTLAKGETDLIELEKTIKQYIALANHDNQQ